jgi:putative transposase
MCDEGLHSQTGYRRRHGQRYGQPAAAPNHVQQQFDVVAPNRIWVTDITYIRTHEGWLYLSVVLDLFSRQVIGWSMQPRMESELAINALIMAVWRRPAKAGSDRAFRSGEPVQQLRLAAFPAGTQPGSQPKSPRQLP